jgi:hypothetical protein
MGLFYSAGELRDMGLEIPDDVPDVAIVPRASVVFGEVEATVDGTDVKYSLPVSFTEPFRWVTAVAHIKGNDNDTILA